MGLLFLFLFCHKTIYVNLNFSKSTIDNIIICILINNIIINVDFSIKLHTTNIGFNKYDFEFKPLLIILILINLA